MGATSLNELAIMLSASLKLVGHLIQAPSERIQLLTEAGTKLESNATDWLRVTNYEQRIKERGKDDRSGTESNIDIPGGERIS